MSAALVLVGHGSRDPGADDVLPYYADQLRGRFDDVKACYLERPPYLEETLRTIREGRIFVMPLLLAGGYHTKVTIPAAIRASGRDVVLLGPIGRSEHLVRLIEERIAEAQSLE